MSTANLLLLLSPLLLLVVVVGAVAVVALNRAESKDVPEVARVFCAIFRRLADRSPMPRPISIGNDETAVVTSADEVHHQEGS